MKSHQREAAVSTRCEVVKTLRTVKDKLCTMMHLNPTSITVVVVPLLGVWNPLNVLAVQVSPRSLQAMLIFGILAENVQRNACAVFIRFLPESCAARNAIPAASRS